LEKSEIFRNGAKHLSEDDALGVGAVALGQLDRRETGEAAELVDEV
jgi:hypothetical protein